LKINVTAFDTMPTPEEIHARLPISDKAAKTVTHGRNLLRKILDRKDPRLFVVVGPCSIHDPVAGLDYARRLKKLSDEVGDTLQIIMRVISKSRVPPSAGRVTSTTRSWMTASASTSACKGPRISASSRRNRLADRHRSPRSELAPILR
jgi:hypothetical protein